MCFCRKKIKLDGFIDVWSSVCASSTTTTTNADPNDIVAVEGFILVTA